MSKGKGIYIADVTLFTGASVKAFVQAQSILDAFQSFEVIYGAGRVGGVRAQSTRPSKVAQDLTDIDSHPATSK